MSYNQEQLFVHLAGDDDVDCSENITELAMLGFVNRIRSCLVKNASNRFLILSSSLLLSSLDELSAFLATGVEFATGFGFLFFIITTVIT